MPDQEFLASYAVDIDEDGVSRLQSIIQQMQHNEGVDEMMKAQDQMLRVGRINSIQQRAEEIVVDELIFS